MTEIERKCLQHKFHWKDDMDELVKKVMDALSINEADAVQFLLSAPVRIRG